jgi:hypothetical protein
MNKTTVLEYKLFLKLYLHNHAWLAEDYAGMKKLITLFDSFIKPLDADLFAHLKTLRHMIDKSQHVNHRAQRSIHHRLQSLKTPNEGPLWKRLRAFLSFSGVAGEVYYLILQEEEQVYAFLKEQHKKIKTLLKQFYAPDLLEHLSNIDLDYVESLEIVLRSARAANKGILRNCNLTRENLKASAPYEMPSTSFQQLIKHCNSWGAFENRIPLRPTRWVTRLRQQCADFWDACLFLWD